MRSARLISDQTRIAHAPPPSGIKLYPIRSVQRELSRTRRLPTIAGVSALTDRTFSRIFFSRSARKKILPRLSVRLSFFFSSFLFQLFCSPVFTVVFAPRNFLSPPTGYICEPAQKLTRESFFRLLAAPVFFALPLFSFVFFGSFRFSFYSGSGMFLFFPPRTIVPSAASKFILR